MSSNENESTNNFTSESTIEQSDSTSNLTTTTTTTITITESRNDLTHEKEEKNSENDDKLIQTSPKVLDGQSDAENTKETTTVNQNDDERRSKKSSYSRGKHPTSHNYRSAYYSNGYQYPSFPYYYYPPIAPFHEKPPPLMLISTPMSGSTDNLNANSTTTSTQNLPPRLRQMSTTENESTTQSSNNSQTITANHSNNTTTNHRRHRNHFSKGTFQYYPTHLPPPLMATPPGVLFTYPPGHISYNIRSAEENELFPFQQPLMNLPSTGPPLVWSTISPYHPQFPAYSAYGPTNYGLNLMNESELNGSLLNPEAAEWSPSSISTDKLSTEANVLIDDEINFPPLNNTKSDEHSIDQETRSNSNKNETTNNITANGALPDENKVSATLKSTPVSYSTVISQTIDVNKSTKNEGNLVTNQRRLQPQNSTITNNLNATTTTKDRSVKGKQRISQTSTKEKTNGRKSLASQTDRYHTVGLKNGNHTEFGKVQSTVTTTINDDWIEVKSKKTKKFDRPSNENFFDNNSNQQEPVVSVEKVQSPVLSVSSTGENTTISSASDDEEELSNQNDSGVGNSLQNNQTQDFNQTIIDDVHQRLTNHQHLLIILRGCPGSGKSTLARVLNDASRGQILSMEEYFDDGEKSIDSSKFEQIQRIRQKTVFEALKKKITPIIIDNTNAVAKEIKPYIILGQQAAYEILLVEPQTPWRYKARTLFKRQVNNLSMKRIREILNRFEHNLTIESILSKSQTEVSIPELIVETESSIKNIEKNENSIDLVSETKTILPIIDDVQILDDVRLCINEMILFITSSFYQTRQGSTSLSPFSDLSMFASVASSSSSTIASSLPSTPSSPHSLFHRSYSRFPSTSNQEHSFSTDHRLRVPSTSFTRCIDNLAASTTNKSTTISKKRRKNKSKNDSSNENLLNTNNNNNNNNNKQLANSFSSEKQCLFDVRKNETFQVILPEDCSQFFVVEDRTKSSEENFSSLNHFEGNNSTQMLQGTKKKSDRSENTKLLSILHDQVKSSSSASQRSPSAPERHGEIDCSSKLFDDSESHEAATISSMDRTNMNVPEDVKEKSLSSLSKIIDFYSTRISEETIRQFYELCGEDCSWTQNHLEEYLKHAIIESNVPSLRQLSLNALDSWDQVLRQSNPLFQSNSFDDLLNDINGDGQFYADPDSPPVLNVESPIEIIDNRNIFIPNSMICSIQKLYGNIPGIDEILSTNEGISIPIDDELNMNIFSALHRFLGFNNTNTNSATPVNAKFKGRDEKKSQNSKWKSIDEPVQSKTKPSNKRDVPSFADIMAEDMISARAEKCQPKPQLDFASQEKMKKLEKLFPEVPRDVIQEIFQRSECDYDLTRITISTMIDSDETNPRITEPSSKKPTNISTRTNLIAQMTTKPSQSSVSANRNLAQELARKRKECYEKANQANRHHMMGVVSYYISQAHQYGTKVKEANQAAYEELAETRLVSFRQTHRLDLHDFHEDEALNLFKRVEAELNNGAIRRTTQLFIEVVTGYGKGSSYGSGHGKIRSRIVNYLKQKNYRYEELNKGAFRVQFTNAYD